MKETVRMVEAMPVLRSGRSEAETCDLLELMLNISLYFRCIGKDVVHHEMGVDEWRQNGTEVVPSTTGVDGGRIGLSRAVFCEVEVVLDARGGWLN